MQASGFVLAGGGSARMDRDKALLANRRTTLVKHVPKTGREAAGSVSVIGSPGWGPAVRAGVLRELLQRAEASRYNGIATWPDGEPEPLSAGYHRRLPEWAEFKL